MPDKPSAEISIDSELVRRILLSQAPARIATLPLTHVADGWDCALWRLGRDLAVRLPRRALAAPLIDHEQRALPLVAGAVEATGVRVPLPLFLGVPTPFYPWTWSIVPWFDGARGLDVPRPRRIGWADPLARALDALHQPGPFDAPRNPVRGVPLRVRAETVAGRFRALRERGALDAAHLARAEQLWRTALDAPEWSRAPVWIHGDLHPGNLVAQDDRLVAIIDFGDVTAGDPAYDLAVAWLAFDPAGRRTFVDATGDRYDDATWVRARGWAAAFAIVLLAQSDDDPDYASLGRGALRELTASDG